MKDILNLLGGKLRDEAEESRKFWELLDSKILEEDLTLRRILCLYVEGAIVAREVGICWNGGSVKVEN